MGYSIASLHFLTISIKKKKKKKVILSNLATPGQRHERHRGTTEKELCARFRLVSRHGWTVMEPPPPAPGGSDVSEWVWSWSSTEGLSKMSRLVLQRLLCSRSALARYFFRRFFRSPTLRLPEEEEEPIEPTEPRSK